MGKAEESGKNSSASSQILGVKYRGKLTLALPKIGLWRFNRKNAEPLGTLALRDVERFWLKKSSFTTPFVEISQPLETARTAGRSDRSGGRYAPAAFSC